MKSKIINRFTEMTIFHFRLIGFELENKSTWMKIKFIICLVNLMFMIAGQALFVFYKNEGIQDGTRSISYLNYGLVAIAKYLAIIYHRKNIYQLFLELNKIYPSEKWQIANNGHQFLKQSLRIEGVLRKFLRFGFPIYGFFPLALSFVDLLKTGTFSYKLPAAVLYGFDIPYDKSCLIYCVVYVQQFLAIFVESVLLMSLDACLYCTLQQLCMHFYIIQQNIIKIRPDGSEKEVKLLVKELKYHQKVLSLAEQLNTVFTPSVLFSLLSSSFIICFTGFQLLGELSLFTVIKAIFLLAYELKQVAITCFLGDKLIEISLKISDAVYEHKWYNGSPKYRRLVLMAMMRSQHSVTLHIAGISDISLQTFRQVMSISYKVFALLRSR